MEKQGKAILGAVAWLAVVMHCVCVASSLPSSTVHVAPWGNDSVAVDGSAAQPYASISWALRQPGVAVIRLLSGTHVVHNTIFGTPVTLESHGDGNGALITCADDSFDDDGHDDKSSFSRANISALTLPTCQVELTSCVDAFTELTRNADPFSSAMIISSRVLLRNLTFWACPKTLLSVGSGADLTIDNCRSRGMSSASKGGVGSIFGNATVTVRDSQFVNGGSSIEGGVFSISDTATLTVNNCTFVGNQANGAGGGAISLTDEAQLRVVASVFARNGALARSGGAVRLLGQSKAVFVVTRFSENTAAESGGAIFMQDMTSVLVTDCAFDDNIALSVGGALYAQDSANITANHTRFVRNGATSFGGGVYLARSSQFAATDVLAAENFAYDKSGGFLFATDSCEIVVTRSVVRGNQCAEYGGGLSLVGAVTLTVHHSILVNNSALVYYGGALHAEGPSRITMSHTAVDGNYAAEYSGAIDLWTDAHMEMVDSTCNDNVALRYGGACALCYLGVEFNLTRVEILRNSGGSDGTIFSVYGPAALHMTNCTVGDTHQYLPSPGASMSGGGIALLDNAVLDLTDVVVRNMTFPTVGAISASSTSIVRTRRTVFTRNTSLRPFAEGGGALLLRGSASAYIQDCTFFRNSASSQGAALFMSESATATIERSTFMLNSVTSVTEGGGSAVFWKAAVVTAGKLTFNNTVIASNSGFYGAVYVDDPALALSGALVLSNTTFWKNVIYAATGGRNVATASNQLQWCASMAKRPPMRLYSGALIADSLSVDVIDGYGNPSASSPSSVLVVRLFIAASPSVLAPESGVVIGETEKAILYASIAFSETRVVAYPGKYFLVVKSSTPLYSADRFHVTLPIEIGECPGDTHPEPYLDTGYPICQPNQTEKQFPVGGVVGGFCGALFLLATGSFVAYRRKKARIEQASRTWIVEFTELSFDHEIGRGTFGRVYLGTFRGSRVAIKTLAFGDLRGSHTWPLPAAVAHSTALSMSKSVDSPAKSLEFNSLEFAAVMGGGDPHAGAAVDGDGMWSVRVHHHAAIGSVEEEVLSLGSNRMPGLKASPSQKVGKTPLAMAAARPSPSADGSSGSLSAAVSHVGMALKRLTTRLRTKREEKHTIRRAVDGFMQEVQTLVRLRHPHIVLFMGASVQAPNLCIITELQSGSLYDLYRAHPEELTWPIRLQLARDAASGMEYLHSSKPPVVHLDLKSPNLLLGDNHRAKVADFGLSRLKLAESIATEFHGTVWWMSPEMLSHLPLNERADVYSYGIVLSEMVCKKRPYWDDLCATEQLIERILYADHRPSLEPDCPPEFAALVKSCWSATPAARPSFASISIALRDMDATSWPTAQPT